MKWKLFLSIFSFLLCNMIITSSSSAQDDLHQIYTELLSEHVQNGWVDYPQLCQDERLDIYTQDLSKQFPWTWSNITARLAFWINAYNAFTLKIVCDNYPIDSINELHFGGLAIGMIFKTTVWDKPFINIGDKKFSLGRIEHQILRPEMNGQVHFTLVCAAKSCPPLRPEAYSSRASEFGEQLNDQGRIFLNNVEKNRFDQTTQTAYLSSIFSWFMKDFARNRTELLLALTEYLPQQTAGAIKKNPKQWKVIFSPYDWSLNEKKIKR